MTPLFIGGTASHVGKSWFTSAFCRLLARRGERVAPFKAQNMSNNSYPCIEGGEIGRSQAAQAEACGVPPMADMNPVLLKPNSATGSQVVVQGKVWNSGVEAMEYGRHTPALFEKALESFYRLSGGFERVVCEGAGGVAEVNLFERDIVNMRLAEAVGARSLLVADIERGGVFASIVGSIELLPESHRRLIRAFAVNRFCGDVRLFDSGVTFLEQRLGIPCLGVFPLDRSISIDDEDSLSIDDATVGSEIAVIRLPRISNFTDFRGFGNIDWIDKPVDREYKVVFLPGTKNTVEDLLWLRSKGLDAWVLRQLREGAKIVGICGGYQMLGESIADPYHVESAHEQIAGLGLLPVRTVFEREKITRVVEARTPRGRRFRAYEIHMGQSTGDAFFEQRGNVLGTYLHSAFDDPDVAYEMLGVPTNATGKDAEYDKLADWLQAHANPQVLAEFTGS